MIEAEIVGGTDCSQGLARILAKRIAVHQPNGGDTLVEFAQVPVVP